MLKQNKITIVLFVLLLSLQVFGQNAKTKQNEGIQVHMSQQLLFPGETLWFSVHSSGLPQTDAYSTVAYVELINKQNAAIVRKKVQLNSGMGSHSIQLPDTLSTGVYTLLAYTKWMKNFGEDSFSKTKLAVIDPDAAYNAAKETDQQANTPAKKYSGTRKFDQRQRIVLNDLLETSNWETGNFSVSVKRKEPLNYSGQKEVSIDTKTPAQIQNLPDYKGIIVSGKLYDSANKTIEEQEVLLSLPGEKTDLLRSVTNSKGSFHFKLDAKAGNSDLVFTLPDAGMKLKLDDPFLLQHNLNGNTVLNLNKFQLEFVKEKYLHHQLKTNFGFNPYTNNKKVESLTVHSTFYTDPNRIIRTDNYVKLDSLAEYFYELIPSVQFHQVQGKYRITITRPQGQLDLGPNPGVFVDGVYFSEFGNIAKIPVEKVDRIEVIWEKYYYKDFAFDGIVSIYTRKADFYSVDLQDNMARIIYPLTDKEEFRFNNKKYTANNLNSRVPDLRYLLLWEPLIANETMHDLAFFTSDVSGIYELKICGYADSGEWLEEIREFEVK